MNNTLLRIREKIGTFLYGRNGFDRLNLALMVVFAVLGFICPITKSFISWTVWTLLLALIIFRTLSRNVPRRSLENSKYLSLRYSVVEFFKLTVRRIREFKTHRFRKCPHCKKTLRLRNVKGKHTTHCPCCGNDFKVNIWL